MGSQLDQESFNDQTLTYCILSELDDTQRLVTSPRVKQKSEDDTKGGKDILSKEDDVEGHRRRPPVVVVQMLPWVGDTSTSTVEAGEAGPKETILKQDGGLGTGDIPTNKSPSLDDDPSDGVFTRGTTVVYNDVSHPNSFCHGAYFMESPDTAGSITMTDKRDDEKRDTLLEDDDPPVRLPRLGMSNAVEPYDDGMLPAPSVVEHGMTGGVKRDDDEAQGMLLMRADRMIDDDVGGTRAPSVMVTSTGVEDDSVLPQNNSENTEPSVDNRGYPGNRTSKNFTVDTNPIVLQAHTVGGGATQARCEGGQQARPCGGG